MRDTLAIIGSNPVNGAFSEIVARAAGKEPGSGSAGEVLIAAASVMVDKGGRIDSSTLGSGNGGNVTVQVSDTLAITGIDPEGIPSAIVAQTFPDSSGSAGEVLIEASRLRLAEGGQISSSTFGRGQGGKVTIRVSENTIITGSNPVDGLPSFILTDALGSEPGSGSAGSILIETAVLLLDEGGLISSSTGGLGDGGKVTLRVSDVLIITGSTPVDGFSSKISVTTSGSALDSGSAGDIFIEASGLVLTTGGQINGNTGGPGQGGNVNVRVGDTLSIIGSNSILDVPSGIFASTVGEGKGGKIAVNAQQIKLSEGAQIQGTSAGTGDAGALTITVQDTLMVEESSIRTNATQADGGDVNITVDFIQFRDGQITTAVGDGDGGGGNITVDTNLGLLERSEIRANAFGGPGGNITIQSNGFITDASSVISASSAQSVDGTVSIQGLADLSGSLSPLDPDFASAASLVARCTDRWQGGELSRFTDAGRDGLPPKPGGLLPSPSGMAAAVAPPARQAAASLSQGQPRLVSTLTAWHRDCVR